MIKQGTGPTKIDHRDYSHKSFRGIQVPFPAEYNTDAGIDVPDQEADGLPNGCTDETQADITNDLAAQSIALPWIIEALTNANKNGGCDIRISLKAAIKLGWITAFYNIEALDGQDMFDAVRDAMASGATEKRSVSVGSKWFPIFESVGKDGLLKTPDLNSTVFTWHNWKISGWKTIGDQVYLVGKSWQGSKYADGGYCYFSRPMFNQLMSVPGSVAFTATRGVLPPISTVSVTWLQWIISYARNLLPY